MTDESRVQELRKLFPVIDHWTYLYNGSIHPCPRPVAEAMRNFIDQWQNGGEDAFFSAYEAFGRLNRCHRIDDGWTQSRGPDCPDATRPKRRGHRSGVYEHHVSMAGEAVSDG